MAVSTQLCTLLSSNPLPLSNYCPVIHSPLFKCEGEPRHLQFSKPLPSHPLTISLFLQPPTEGAFANVIASFC